MIGAVVMQVAECERVGTESVFAAVFCAWRTGDKAVFKVCMCAGIDAALFGNGFVLGPDVALAVITVDTCAVACGYLQAAVLLFAMVGDGVLHAFYVEVSAVRPDAFANHLRTSECGVAAASDDGLAALVANIGIPAGVAFVIATAFANIAANTNT